MLPADVPVQLGREEAARLARDELSDPAYHSGGESLLWRGLRWVVERIEDLLDRVGSGPGGWYSVLGLLVVVAVVVAVVRRRMGPTRRRAGARDALFDDGLGELCAQDHRDRALRAERAGDHAGAVRERLRAVVRELEERDLLDARPGRTAREAATAAATVLPDLAERLAAGADRFERIWYGGETADAADARSFAALDDAVRTAVVAAPARAVR